MEQPQPISSRHKYKFSNIPGLDTLTAGPTPLFQRKCTDFCCGVLFLLIFCYFSLLGSSAIYFGDVANIGAAYDPDHRACGVSEEAIDYPYLYFATPIIDSSGNYLYRTVCLKECPSGVTTNIYASTLECLTNSQVTSCEFKSSPINESLLFYNTVPCNFH